MKVSLREYVEMCRVEPGDKAPLKGRDPDWNGNSDIPKPERKEFAKEHLAKSIDALKSAQDLLYAADTWSILLIFQAMDSAGKDSAIKHVMSGLNPQGCQVYSYKHPSAEELDHNFLWRCMKDLPERGRIGIFNRSYYEEVLIVKVHRDLVRAQRIPGADPDKDSFWEARYEDINAFERHLVRNGTVVLKFFLHLSREEQRKRFLKRVTRPEKHWKFSPADLSERAYWDDYMRAYEEMLAQTSTKWAPWHVVPADHKWITRALVANTLCSAVERLDLRYPEVTPEMQEEIEKARRQLEKEERADD